MWWIIVALLLAKWGAQIWLDRLNARTVKAHAGAVPAAFVGIIDEFPRHRKHNTDAGKQSL